MPLMKTVASSLAGRRMAKSVSRRIPNPILRFAVVTAATTLAPMIARRVQAAWQRRQVQQRLKPLELSR